VTENKEVIDQAGRRKRVSAYTLCAQ